MALVDQKFLRAMPGGFRQVLGVLQEQGLLATVVGGVPRDFILRGEVGRDWDIEVSSPTVSFNKDLWKNLARLLGALGKVSLLPYEVIRLDYQGCQYELSPPRRETFKADWQTLGHSNFDAEFDLRLPFEAGVKRRDFTINAIGFRFVSAKEAEILDPLDGIRHLHERTLHPAGPDFAKDPLRFFRALRFSRNLGFEYSDVLRNILKTMTVKSVSPAHLWSELQKSKSPLSFYTELLQWRESHPDLVLPLGEEVWQRREDLGRMLTDPTKHETWVIALEWVGLSSEGWQKFFSLSGDTTARLGRWARTTRDFATLAPETFHGDFEVVREHPQFEVLFDWYFTTKQLLQKKPELPLLAMIEEFVPEWAHLYKFEPVKDVKHIDPPFRAKYQVWNLCQRL